MSKNPTASFTLPTEPIRVSIVAGDPLARAGLASALATADAIDITENDAEVAIVDAGTDPAGPHLEALETLTVPAVVLVADPAHTQRALAAGARGVLVRDQLDASLVAALAAARQGLTVVDHTLSNVPALRRGAPAEALTRRESEVLGLMTDGLSNKLIAVELGISEHTAKFHIGSILEKLDSDTRTGAVVTGLRLGLVSL